MSKRSFRIALIAVISSIVVVGLVTLWLIRTALAYPNLVHEGDGSLHTVEVRSGMSFPAIARALADADVIERPTWFRLYAMWRGVTSDVKSGTYVIANNLTPHDVLEQLLVGVKDKTVNVPIPEGLNMLEVFDILDKFQVAKAAELTRLARDPEFLQKHGIAGESVDGYLFPATYNFRVGEKPVVVLERLINKHRQVWNGLATKHAKSLKRLKDRLKWSDRDVLTLASIVEKEAVKPIERPRIAQVFVNRLTDDDFNPKRLETDPTIRYGCLVEKNPSAACVAWNEPCRKAGKPVGCDSLHRAQLDDRDNPYNTYQHEGLPPGPISNPGESSMEGALEPDGSNYFYFVAKPGGGGEHAFARTLDEHKRNVDKYLHGN
jgi:UPF0755 protein